MEKDVSDFLQGRHDLLILYDKNGEPAFKFERDKTNTDNQMILESFLGEKYTNDIVWNKHWRKYYGKYVDPDKRPKSTGGKAPYTMLMVNEIKELLDKNIKYIYEVLGFLNVLSIYMDFNTGKLIDKRQRAKKKQLPLQYNDLLEVCCCNRTKLDKLLKISKEHNLIYYEKPTKDNNGGYFISANIIKKGKRGVIE